MNIEKLKDYAPVVLRIGLALIFLWFGISQLVNPQSFLGYVPQWLVQHPPQMVHSHPLQMFHQLPLTSHVIIMGNGAFEVLMGLLLITGLLTRWSSLLLSLHLLFIMLGLGYNDLAVRDFGLMLATFTIFMHGSDKLCLENKVRDSKFRDTWLGRFLYLFDKKEKV